MIKLFVTAALLSLTAALPTAAAPHFKIILPHGVADQQAKHPFPSSYSWKYSKSDDRNPAPGDTGFPAPVPSDFTSPMRPPSAADFFTAAAPNKAYVYSVPKAFGKNPLEGFSSGNGTMLTHISSDNLYCAAQVIAPEYADSYKPGVPLPEYKGKKVLLNWRHDSLLSWNCVLSKHNDFFGDKYILQGQAREGTKTCQLLYVFPKGKFYEYFPQVLYSLNSFKLQ